MGPTARCSCARGWRGKKCEISSTSAKLLKRSFAKLALSFNPDPYVVSLELELRTRQLTGLVAQLASHHREAAFTIFVSTSSIFITWVSLSN